MEQKKEQQRIWGWYLEGHCYCRKKASINMNSRNGAKNYRRNEERWFVSINFYPYKNTFHNTEHTPTLTHIHTYTNKILPYLVSSSYLMFSYHTTPRSRTTASRALWRAGHRIVPSGACWRHLWRLRTLARLGGRRCLFFFFHIYCQSCPMCVFVCVYLCE